MVGARRLNAVVDHISQTTCLDVASTEISSIRSLVNLEDSPGDAPRILCCFPVISLGVANMNH